MLKIILIYIDFKCKYKKIAWNKIYVPDVAMISLIIVSRVRKRQIVMAHPLRKVEYNFLYHSFYLSSKDLLINGFYLRFSCFYCFNSKYIGLEGYLVVVLQLQFIDYSSRYLVVASDNDKSPLMIWNS